MTALVERTAKSAGYWTLLSRTTVKNVEDLLEAGNESEWLSAPTFLYWRVTNSLENEFKLLADQWRQETAYLSATDVIIMNSNYQRIIGMGADVVPLILKDLEKKPDHWFWALQILTRANPVRPEDRGHMRNMANAWLEWGRQQCLVA